MLSKNARALTPERLDPISGIIASIHFSGSLIRIFLLLTATICFLHCGNGEVTDDCLEGQTECDGNCVNLQSDTQNCGKCGEVCSVDNGSGACEAGSCVVDSCQAPYGDCDNSYGNGCETDLTDNLSNCGRCNIACLVANGTPGCADNACFIAGCDHPYSDCDGSYSNGCEIDTGGDPANCPICTDNNCTTIESLSLTATFQSIGVYAAFSGDQNENGVASVEYKRSADSTWILGMDAAKAVRGAQEFIGSVLLAEPDTEYDVRIVVTDLDGVAGNLMSSSISTWFESFPSGTGTTYYVSPDGDDDNNTGTEEVSPFETIQHTADIVQPGDTVRIMPGTYREAVGISRSGAPGQYITWQSHEPGAPAVLDGSDEALATSGGDIWSPNGGGLDIFQTDITFTPTGYVAVDGQRLFPHNDLSDLQDAEDGIVGGSHATPFGWAYSTGTLYVRTYDRDDPDSHEILVARRAPGFSISGDYIIIRGLTIRNFGGGWGNSGIWLENSADYIVLEGNTIENCHAGIRQGSGEGGHHIVIQDNTISDAGPTLWPWRAAKGDESPGIELFGTRESVIRRNTIDGHIDGINVNFWESGSSAYGHNYDTDIYDNTILNNPDDACELESSDETNVRFWNNYISGSFSGISVNPVGRGPIYIFRNVINTFDDSFSGGPTVEGGALKVGSCCTFPDGGHSVGRVYLYHNTFRIDNGISAAESGGREDDGVTCTNMPGYWNHEYRNNIFYVGGYIIANESCQTDGTVSYDYDLLFRHDPLFEYIVKWDGDWYATIEEVRAGIGLEMNGIYGDPLFENLASGNLELSDSSPAIDNGMLIQGFNDTYSAWPAQGLGPDMGAFEKR